SGMSSVFGGGGTDSLFGGKGATPFFVKLTSGLAIAFFLTSLILVLYARAPRRSSAVEKVMQEQPVEPVPEKEPGPMFPKEGGE
ncbi:MAG: preprotein translocase subunit SecG, partial [candidate division WOR-3 bacterium]